MRSIKLTCLSLICLCLMSCASLHENLYTYQKNQTVINALKSASKKEDSYGKYPGLRVSLQGPLSNEKEIDEILAKLQGRDSVEDPGLREEMRLKVYQ